MDVLFRYSPDFTKVQSVYWQGEDGKVMRKVLRADGSVAEEPIDWPDLATVCNRIAGAHTPMYPAVVDDLRSAFQYLGKASDLVETLPEADIGCNTTTEPAA